MLYHYSIFLHLIWTQEIRLCVVEKGIRCCHYTNIVSLSEYAGHKFVSSIQKDNNYGVQFHPEKSRDAGIQLLKNFINLGENNG